MSDMIDGRGNTPRPLPEFDVSDVIDIAAVMRAYAETERFDLSETEDYDLFEYTIEALPGGDS